MAEKVKTTKNRYDKKNSEKFQGNEVIPIIAWNMKSPNTPINNENNQGFFEEWEAILYTYVYIL